MANAASVTGRLTVKNPNVPTMTVGQSTVGCDIAYRRPSRSPDVEALGPSFGARAGSRIIASAASGPR